MLKCLIAAAALIAVPAAVDARPGLELLGQDAAACAAGQGPAVQVNIAGLKDSAGELWVELYPANEADFLRAEEDLAAQHKVFRRTRAKATSALAAMCIRAPHPGRYALMLRHNRTGRDKFSLFSDGVGFPGNKPLGRSRPHYTEALIDIGPGVVVTTVRLQYLRGLGGFSPLKG